MGSKVCRVTIETEDGVWGTFHKIETATSEKWYDEDDEEAEGGSSAALNNLAHSCEEEIAYYERSK